MPPRPFRQHFGFHAMFNWPKVLDYDRLLERFKIAVKSPALSRPDSYIMKSFCEMNPEITRKLLADISTDPVKMEK
jgi:hypothetical protein